MFQTIDLKNGIGPLEEEILDFWNREKIFERSVNEKPEDDIFFFYDGPPFATGLPHYGHLLAGTIKDVIPRYQSMLGKRVERRFGWDCHGLPVEFEVEKELNLKGKADIEAMGIDKFNESCRGIVLRYTNEWKSTVRRMGRWVDLENDYKTMDPDFMESIWWVCQRLWEKGLLYQSGKIVPYSARLNTPLSNFEVNLGYRDTADPSITVKFKLKDEENASLLVWTTTPWTLPSNVAVCAHPDLEYSLVEADGEKFYLCSESVPRLFKEGNAKLLKTLKGGELEKRAYEPLFPYFSRRADNAFFVVSGEYVDSATGTGLVHIAPAFGEDDFEASKKHDLPLVLPFDDSGRFTSEVPDFRGLFFKDADKPIIRHLKECGAIFRHETINHNYPFCWRSDTPLMYRWIPSWYVDVEKIKAKMIENNLAIHWKPEHIRKGRMGKWIENAKDWAISRNRYWGTPIPIWICDSCENLECLGSRKELEEKSGVAVSDLHRHFIDDLTWNCPKCGGAMKRTPEVLDCWFESGSMPYGQEHYPFESKEKFESAFPADFISEGLDQTRGWFYTLIVLGSALFEKPAFKNCIVSGLILAEDGKKMSKRLKNYPEPKVMIGQYGADAIRLYMLNSGAIKGEELKFSEAGLREVLRGVIIPLLNAVNFFSTYAEIDGWKPGGEDPGRDLENPLDHWILSKYNSLVREVKAALEDYDLNLGVAPFLAFIGDLTNWYIRRSRRRFWKSEALEDKRQAYRTLHFVLKGISKVIAPFIPFVADLIHRSIRGGEDPESVHLCAFPEFSEKLAFPAIERKMDLAMKVVEMGRTLRTSEKLNLRRPLANASVISTDPEIRRMLEEVEPIIRDELNVRGVSIMEDESGMVEYSCRPNLPVLGPKYGKKMKTLIPLLRALESETLSKLSQSNETLELRSGEDAFPVCKADLLIDHKPRKGFCVLSQGNLTISLDTALDASLIREGLLREAVSKIQQTRKKLNLKVDQRIDLEVEAEPKLKEAIEAGIEYLKTETLTETLRFVSAETAGESFEIEGESFNISIQPL